MSKEKQIHVNVPAELGDARFDHVAVKLFPDYSRSRLQKWIKDGVMTVNGQVLRAKDKVFAEQHIELTLPHSIEVHDQAEAIALQIVYEDECILVLNKPAGLVVHPGAGNQGGTLLNALLYHVPEASGLPRAGIVHRLDKDTTGLMVVAKSLSSHAHLVAQLQAREFNRQYFALCQGIPTTSGTVDAPIGRHVQHRQKMAVLDRGGKTAITHYKVEQRFVAHSLLRCKLDTGRTHQIRVHMAHIRHPLLGDKRYNPRPKLPRAASEVVTSALQQFPRQALHATILGLTHPKSGEYCEWQQALPEDMHRMLKLLSDD